MKICTLKYINDEYPPPYKYQFEATIELNTGKISITQHYLERDSLTLTEIEEAGFSNNDDFVWNGQLEGNWVNYLSRLPEKFTQNAKGAGTITYVENSVESTTLYPNNLEMEKLIQAMIQAVLEGKAEELPLTIGIQLPESKAPHTLHIEFKSLNAYTHTPDGHIKPVNWDAAMQFIQSIYMTDFDEYASSSHKPVAGKFCVALEPQVWLYADEQLERRNKFPDFSVTFKQLIQ
jgi:hypothetical protein